ncbi:MAG TPA: MBL fold metallo-hydrolase [Nitrososphaerales archaeon]|nr:MBL fold metallo-hydrolase [Nitrososphaerales archaeon]
MDGELVFQQFIREHTGCVSYLIGSAKTGKSILVDPLIDTERYEPFLKRNDLEIVALVDTHTHADHLSGLRYFSTLFPRAILAIHEAAPTAFECKKLEDGDYLNEWIGASTFTIKILYTPGHATDHVSLLLEYPSLRNLLLSGDCLFIGDVGRTDLGRGDNDLMYDSLFHKLLSLDPSTEVYPAHIGAKHFLATEKVKTQIGTERDTNPALQVKSKEEFLKYMTEGWPPKPPYYEKIIKVNLGLVSLSEAQEEVLRSEKERLK